MSSTQDYGPEIPVVEVPLYDQFSEDYDRFVNWEGRLSFEWPFLSSRLEAAGARRVLDVACGTGQHSIALARAGYEVVGADLSQAMIAVAQSNARESGVDVKFIVAGFGQLAETGPFGGRFDAILCLGNSLPHAMTAEALREALRDFGTVLRPGGLLIVQNRNFDLVWETRERFMPPETHRDGNEERIFIRFYDFHEETITFNVNTLHRTGTKWISSIEGTELRPIFRDEMTVALSETGFAGVELYGGLAGEPFDPRSSGNLVAVARLL